MKTRIVLTILILILAGWLSRSVVQPVSTLAKNTAAVATVNGGGAEYVAQQAVNETTSYPWAILIAGAGICLIWVGPINAAIKKSQQPS